MTFRFDYYDLVELFNSLCRGVDYIAEFLFTPLTNAGVLNGVTPFVLLTSSLLITYLGVRVIVSLFP